MQTGKRVYPRQREPGKWLSYLLLFLSAVVVISGVVSRGGDLTIEPAATATPIPTDAYFDETVEEREITLPSATWYALQLGAFESETAAQELGQQFVKRGAAGYVWHDGRYRTLAAVYPSLEDAQAVREQLSEAHSRGFLSLPDRSACPASFDERYEGTAGYSGGGLCARQ